MPQKVNTESECGSNKISISDKATFFMHWPSSHAAQISPGNKTTLFQVCTRTTGVIWGETFNLCSKSQSQGAFHFKADWSSLRGRCKCELRQTHGKNFMGYMLYENRRKRHGQMQQSELAWQNALKLMRRLKVSSFKQISPPFLRDIRRFLANTPLATLTRTASSKPVETQPFTNMNPFSGLTHPG